MVGLWPATASTMQLAHYLDCYFSTCMFVFLSYARQVIVSGPYKGVALLVLMDGKDKGMARRRKRSISFEGSEDTEVISIT